jgi:RND family efflux transporter MFP subunit
MVAGKVNYIAAEEGQSVEQGQLLASLDPESYATAKDIADANLDQTQDEYNRLSQMHEHKSISESDFSKITNALKAAKAQQRLQAKNLSDTKLFSPINGVLLKKGVEVGEIIGVGLPLLVVSDIQTVKVNASVPESDLHSLHTGNEANVYISSLDSDFTGKITEIGSLAEATTRSFSVKIELKNPKRLIRPGMVAEVRIKTGEKSQNTTVPAEAILRDIDNSSYVFVADTIKNQAFKRKISLGNILGNNIEVISGLMPGESIVVGGQQKLSNGSSINLK